MKWSTFMPLSAYALALLPSTGAWQFTWTDASNTTHIESGHGPSECIRVNHEKGGLFAIDSKGEKNINMMLYHNPDCKGEPAGMATEYFSKESSVDIRGFQVVSLSTGSNSTTTATSRQSSSATKSETSAATATPTKSTTGTSQSAGTTTSASETSSPTPNASVRLSLTGHDMVKTAIGLVAGIATAQWLC
ncbi:hypothetical protein ETB97_003951 [Aspergillus alliaceus]|uniref:Uncharacterized protein n=1 Tax=Petromyces alliaceus TaxID=209559 RepID=A0A8H5ZYH8_PETAA|nr:hypothetical protein ETB97_003951 [Aspergillus burnettii]